MRDAKFGYCQLKDDTRIADALIAIDQVHLLRLNFPTQHAGNLSVSLVGPDGKPRSNIATSLCLSSHQLIGDL